MTKTKEKIECSTCGAPFHGLSACSPDAPGMVARQRAARIDACLGEIIDCGAWIARNGSTLAGATAWKRLDTHRRGTLLMELRHDLEAALKAVAALEKEEGGA